MPAVWGKKGAETGELIVYNRLDISQTALRWNGEIISQATLLELLAEVPKLDPLPVMVVIVAQGTDCGKVLQIRQVLESRLQCSTEKKCMEYGEAEWRQRHPPPPACDADCQAYGRAGGSDRGLTAEQKRRLKANYIDKYGSVPW